MEKQPRYHGSQMAGMAKEPGCRGGRMTIMDKQPACRDGRMAGIAKQLRSHDGRVLIWQRRPGAVMVGLPEWPNSRDVMMAG